MNVRYPSRVSHSFSIKNIFYDKMALRLIYFDMARCSKHKIIINFKNVHTFSILTRSTAALDLRHLKVKE